MLRPFVGENSEWRSLLIEEFTASFPPVHCGADGGKKLALFLCYPIKTFSNVKSVQGKQKYFSVPIE